ncbi:TPA: type I-B CRISPR-associated protein Cas7/Cst2/DevR [Clostridium botulinum]|uniref:type I-B CRISPR-associated protein Cas7/Cst2/DevR n=1 Tax=Clostridium botulinum TaxID=1491 RepID=UPI0008FCD19F|nr:type I-B CRISPR-associated protein Cas7/Cst2/DevR [Clostridium botulinum]APC81695.1 CRISPR-associated autoregulator DevR family protein [Clostridium botulinum]MCS4448322.1 type I-B CRISPR-associated protein Cas7/Cst2/DevR [Clostridium botulinum]MCS4459284.1 type I-B CRISPR-associated protein Cas7/Cst2/DevR [Clostridium botulinum]MCS4461802.1 type I-B CRISPR-associated protein Cas7/Cst2/DevR [Clostridium botulinum]MCS4512055.1 type I-B CRISPR-associated protein Cas7/Cst2/DevR [Clostridium bo
MFYNIATISKVNLGSLNGSEGVGGNITPIKKITDNQGEEYAYISGQAQRRYYKETLSQLGERITAVNEKGNPNFLEHDDKIYDKKKEKFENKELMYKEFCDLDLFGYMLPNGGRRWSPVKVSPMVSIHPYKGEYDYLTRKQYVKDEGKKSGNIVQIEIDTLNYMRGNILIDVDKIGKEINEYTYGVTSILSEKETNNRINKLVDAVRFFNGGAKQARNLEDISPKFVVAVKQKTGNPFLLNSIYVDKYNNLDAQAIIDEIKDNEAVVINTAVGLARNIFANENEIKEEFNKAGIKVFSVTEALNSLKIGVE